MTVRTVHFSSALAGIALLLLGLNAAQMRAQDAEPKAGGSSADVRAQADSAAVTKLLSDAKWHAALAEYDADTLVTFTYGEVPWQAHADQLRMISEHVSDLGKVVNELNGAKPQASPWQQVAIERITHLLNTLSTSMNTTIKELRDHQDRANMPAFRDYIRSNADLVSMTSTTIGDFVQYSRAGQQTEALQKKLELPPK